MLYYVNKKEKEEENVKKVVLFIVTCAISVLVLESVFLICEGIGESPVFHSKYNAENEKVNVEIGEVLPNITILGCTSIKLPSNSKTAQVELKNPVENADYYDLTYTLCLEETGDTVFTTGLIPPRKVCKEVSIKKKLEKGEYKASILVQPYRIDEKHTPMNNAVLRVLLIVE